MSCPVLGAAFPATILMYHHISSSGPDGLAEYRLSPSAFQEQMRYLSENCFSVLSIDHVIGGLRSGVKQAARTVCLTFDDAYQSFYDEALPVLEQYGFEATVFIPTSFVGGEASWDAEFGPPAKLMAWDTISTLPAKGVELGAHSQTHRELTTLSETEMRSEIAGSMHVLESLTNIKPTGFSYPFCDYNSGVRAIVEEAGFQYAVRGYAPREAIQNLLELPRTEIKGDLCLAGFVQIANGRDR